MFWKLLGLPTVPTESFEGDTVVWEEEDTPSEWEPPSVSDWELYGLKFMTLSQELARKNFERNRRLMRSYMETFTKVPYGY